MKRFLAGDPWWAWAAPFAWLALMCLSAWKGEAWLAGLCGVMSGLRFGRWAKALGRYLRERDRA